jgi:hypothetical protein
VSKFVGNLKRLQYNDNNNPYSESREDNNDNNHNNNMPVPSAESALELSRQAELLRVALRDVVMAVGQWSSSSSLQKAPLLPRWLLAL